ncbi:hypothetical protein [Winogradskyella sp.]|uniref:hypothetical protein n=1 Tax=Winogradskyella sp. TaxID=1883156 RepID=UPI00263629B1|nr:hypothetical protein [Winogradskyella sp.]
MNKDLKQALIALLNSNNPEFIETGLLSVSQLGYPTHEISKLFDLSEITMSYQIGHMCVKSLFSPHPTSSVYISLIGEKKLIKLRIVYLNSFLFYKNKGLVSFKGKSDSYCIKQINRWKREYIRIAIESFYKDNGIKYQSFNNKKQLL